MINKTRGLLLFLTAVLLIIFFFLIPDISQNLPAKGQIILSESGEIIYCFLNNQEQWCLPHSEKTPEKYKMSLLNYEDRWFYKHPGINPISLIKALWLNIKNKRIISGGSTLTMQVVRIANPGKRSYLKKTIEIFQAIKLEILYSKDEILNFYFDHAPFGGNIRGIRAASLKYYQKEPRNLSWGEATTLAVLPNAPGLISPGKNQKMLINKRNKLLTLLNSRKIIDKQTLKISLLEPIPEKVYPLPRIAPHAALRLKSKNSSAKITATINLETQTRTEEILLQHSEYLQNLGIDNCAAIVCDTETGKIRAYCGSQDFNDFAKNGQVDGIKAPRSSGSILKPFLYAMSFDDGLIIPQTLMKDIPSYYGSFSPENANLKYDGLVTAEDALIRSLNVPAVRLLYSFGYDRFHFKLKKMGLTTLFRNADAYGLTLVIGGAETRLDEITGLYRGLATGENFSNIYLDTSQKTEEGISLISPAAAYLTLDILKNLNRPGSEYYWHQYTNQSPIAWKTGTSFGQRDGWAIGTTPQWTIGVWVGNFTGEGNPTISGAGSAGPILFDIFNSLSNDNNWFNPPLNQMDAVIICHDSGFIAGKNCSRKDTVLVPFWSKPLAKCPYHHKIIVNNDETREVCSLCWDPDNYHEKYFTVYPPEVVKYLKKRGILCESIPKHLESCSRDLNNNPIAIIYPTEDSKLYIPKEIDGTRQKVTFQAATSNNNTVIYWYLDNIYLGITEDEHEMSLSPNRGDHKLYLVDSEGNDASINFSVKDK